MTIRYAEEIDGWHYEDVYSFYDLSEDPEDRKEFLDSSQWANAYFAVLDDAGGLAGYFVFEEDGEDLVLGLGMRPDLTGRGLGAAFLQAGLAFARKRCQPKAFRLSVAAFNRRAIRAYEKAGFARTCTFQKETNGGTHEFVEMTRES